MSYPSTYLVLQPLEEEASVIIIVLYNVELWLNNLSKATELELEPGSFIQIRPELDPKAVGKGFPVGWNGHLTLGRSGGRCSS